MKLEIGKSYATAKGQRVRIDGMRMGCYVGSSETHNCRLYLEDGTFSANEPYRNLNLVCEVPGFAPVPADEHAKTIQERDLALKELAVEIQRNELLLNELDEYRKGTIK